VSSVTEEIKQRVDLVELIGRTVQLRRAGSYYRGLCPFHTEKTPSFYVSPDRGTWHCFGCDRSGTAFDWLMQREHLDFSEALRTLAHQTGVQLEAKRDPQDEERHHRLLSILQRTQAYYDGLLWGASGASARQYLQRRGINEETARSFGLGYALSWSALLRYLAQEGFTDEQELQAAGVISIADDGRPFDFFRDRLLFPIRDTQGRTIAFGGRSLDDAATPKYLNSRDTLLFHKQETLFAYDQARRTAAQERQMVIVEGYIDALMAHQHGYRNVVATLGTALTGHHLRQLQRHVEDIVLALDPDAAGQAATDRALQLADETLRSGLTPVVGPNRRQQRFVPSRSVRLRVLALPQGKDPDDLIRSDPLAWPALVRGAEPVIEFVLRRIPTRHDLSAAAGRAAAAREITAVLVGIADPIEQDYYAQLAEDLLRTAAPTAADEAAGAAYYNVRRLLARKQQRGAAKPVAANEPPTGQVRGDNDDDYLLALLMRLRELPDQFVTLSGDLEFMLPESRAVFHALGGDFDPQLEPYAERARRWLPDVRRLPVERLAAELEHKRLEIRRRLLERRRTEIRALGDEEEVRKWTGQLSELARRIGEIDRQLPPEWERAATG
jgi:DNA primase